MTDDALRAALWGAIAPIVDEINGSQHWRLNLAHRLTNAARAVLVALPDDATEHHPRCIERSHAPDVACVGYLHPLSYPTPLIASPATGADPEGLDVAYRERNAVVAALVRSNGWPASLVPAPDADGWWIVYAETSQGQVSWHVGPADLDLFGGIAAEYVKWDGHTTEEKYARLARLAPDSAQGEAE